MLPEIGRDGLQYDDVRSIGGSIGHVQNQDGKGDEGEQGHIIGDEHGTEKRQQHQHERQKTQCLFTAKQAQRQRLEQTTATQPGHDGHQAEKQAQHAEVEIGNIRRGGRHKKSGGRAASAAQQRTASLRIKFKMRAGERCMGYASFREIRIHYHNIFLCGIQCRSPKFAGETLEPTLRSRPPAPGKAFAVVQNDCKTQGQNALSVENGKINNMQNIHLTLHIYACILRLRQQAGRSGRRCEAPPVNMHLLKEENGTYEKACSSMHGACNGDGPQPPAAVPLFQARLPRLRPAAVSAPALRPARPLPKPTTASQ